MADYAKGEQLRSLREAAHMSREDAAHAIGVTTRALYVWEVKDGPIKWENAQRAAKVYGVEPETLVSREKLGGYGEQLDRMEQQLAELRQGQAELLKRLAAAQAEEPAARPKKPPPRAPRKPKPASGQQ